MDAAESGWQLEAWAVFSNHYHFVARPALENLAKEDLGIMLAGLVLTVADPAIAAISRSATASSGPT